MGLWKTDLVKLARYHFYDITDLADVMKFCRALTWCKVLLKSWKNLGAYWVEGR